MTPERIKELRAFINKPGLSGTEGVYIAQVETSDCLDTIEAQAARIVELEDDLQHLAKARQAHINASDHYNDMREIMKTKEPGSMNITAEYHALNERQSEFIRAAQDVADRQIARAALKGE